MQLEHTFTVPVSAEEALEVLTDIERVAPCMPGASLDEIEGDEFTGRVRVKVGPMEVSYRGTARFLEVEPDAHRVVLEARGRQEQGSGTADATVTAELSEDDEATRVTVTTDLAITGRPAQFGRGLMDDVGAKLLGEFADCLARELSSEETTGTGAPAEAERVEEAEAGEAETATGAVDMGRAERRRARPGSVGLEGGPPRPADVPRPQRGQDRAEPAEVLDLLELAGPSVVKRYGPPVLLLALAALVLWWVRR